MAVARRTEAGAREDRVADEQEVALALVDLDGLGDLEAVGGEPLDERGRLGGPLAEAELGAVRDPVDDEPAVGRVDHVGQPLERVDQVDLVTELDVGVVERLPLLHGEIRVGGTRGLHPRVDAVAHREVRGLAHEVPAVLLDALGRRLGGGGGGSGHLCSSEERCGGRCPGARWPFDPEAPLESLRRRAGKGRSEHAVVIVSRGRRAAPATSPMRGRHAASLPSDRGCAWPTRTRGTTPDADSHGPADALRPQPGDVGRRVDPRIGAQAGGDEAPAGETALRGFPDARAVQETPDESRAERVAAPVVSTTSTAYAGKRISRSSRVLMLTPAAPRVTTSVCTPASR